MEQRFNAVIMKVQAEPSELYANSKMRTITIEVKTVFDPYQVQRLFQDLATSKNVRMNTDYKTGKVEFEFL